jgi:hypothetical protein
VISVGSLSRLAPRVVLPSVEVFLIESPGREEFGVKQRKN